MSLQGIRISEHASAALPDDRAPEGSRPRFQARCEGTLSDPMHGNDFECSCHCQDRARGNE